MERMCDYLRVHFLALSVNAQDMETIVVREMEMTIVGVRVTATAMGWMVVTGTIALNGMLKWRNDGDADNDGAGDSDGPVTVIVVAADRPKLFQPPYPHRVAHH
eukprot:21191-Chlamydomonas_euryale.AAC.1